LKLDCEFSGRGSRVESSGAVLDVFVTAVIRELPDRLVRPVWARAKTAKDISAVQIGMTHESSLGIEIGANREMLRLESITIAVVIERHLMAPVVARPTGRLRTSPEHVDDYEIGQEKLPVHAVCLVRPRSELADRSIRENHANGAAAEHVSLHPNDREIRFGDVEGDPIVGEHVEDAHAESSDPS